MRNKIFRIMDHIGYYLSFMLLFHALYFIRQLSAIMLEPSIINTSYGILGTTICVLCIILGLLSTILICRQDYSVIGSNAIGDTVLIEQAENAVNADYSLLVTIVPLMALLIPPTTSIFNFILYALVVVAVGIIYIRSEIFYVNPMLNILFYNIYVCQVVDISDGCNLWRTDEDDVPTTEKTFITRKIRLHAGMTVCYQSTAKNIIFLKSQESVADNIDDNESA